MSSQYSTGKRQRGLSLLSTMIGLVVGLASVLAIMNVYLAQSRQLEGTNAEPGIRKAASRNGQLSVGLVVLQTEMQQAGFGVEGAEVDTHIVSETNAGGDINALGWTWTDAGVDQCAAVRYVPTNDEGEATERGRVDLVRLLTPCTAQPPLPTGIFDAVDAADIEVIAADVPPLTINLTAQSADCTLGTDPDPTTSESGALVQLSAPTSVAGLPVQSSFCLYNIR